MSFLEKIFGSYSDKEIKRIRPVVAEINELEPRMAAMTDEELQGQLLQGLVPLET